jgi:hypothetical protein
VEGDDPRTTSRGVIVVGRAEASPYAVLCRHVFVDIAFSN